MLPKYRKPRMQPRDEELDGQIGARVRQAREAKNMTQVDLGRILGRKSPASAMHKAEKGIVGLNASDLKKIADQLDVSLDWLIRGEQPKGLDPILTVADRDRILDQFQASSEARAALAENLAMYTHHRVTASYVVGFLLGYRTSNDPQAAADSAVLAAARDAAIAETGSAERLKPGALRKRRKR